MSKKNKSVKVTKSVGRAFSDAFYLAIKTVCDVKVVNDIPVSRVDVAKELLASDTVFGTDNLQILSLFVGYAVKEGHVEGYRPLRGRNGGIVNLAQRAAHIAAVEAENASVAA